MRYVCRIRRMSGLLFYGLLVLLTACGAENTSSGVFPGVVLLTSPNMAEICTGTLVSANTVLTAKHCVQSSGTYSIAATQGTYFSSNIVRSPSDDVSRDMAFVIFIEAVGKKADVMMI